MSGAPHEADGTMQLVIDEHATDRRDPDRVGADGGRPLDCASLVGGLIGVGFGFAVSQGLTQFLQWPTSVPADAVAVSVGFAAVIGIVFGFYPAWKGAQLDPIESLRFE